MQSDPQSSRDGRPPSSAQAELQELRETCRQQAHAIARLTETLTSVRRSGGPAAGTWEARLVLDADAPAAARALVADVLGERVPASVLHDALLLASELTSNSVRHSGVGPEGVLVLRVRLCSASVLIDVHDLGVSGVPALHEPTPDGDGLGLHIVQALSEAWGMERDAAVGTRVWARIGTAATPSSLQPLP
jgi:serine/threonine-protein kinase RsbW